MNVNLALKRLLDLSVAICLIIILFPVVTIVSALIAFQDGFPVLFRQKRPGKDEKIFEILKFRTMRLQKAGMNLSDHERMTKLGTFLRKSSLDEIPQLFNVIKGEISLVGPRPLLIEYLPLYNQTQKKRHLVKPGITGWAQVNGRNAISWEEKFKYDIWYVENWSLLLDFKILVMTFFKVIKRSGVNANANVTMEKFTGSKNE